MRPSLARLQQELGIRAAAPTTDPSYGPLAAWVRQGPTASGAPMSPELALRISPVYGCVRLLQDAVASIPLDLYRRDENGKKSRADDHPLYPVLKYRPNAFQTASEFRGLMQADIETRGNSYAVKVRIDGRLTELIHVPASRVKVHAAADGGPRYEIAAADGSGSTPLGRERVMHIRGPFGTGLEATAPAVEFRELFGLAQAIDSFLAYSFANGVRPSVALSTPNKLTDKAYANLKQWIETEYSGYMKAGKPMLLEEGLEPKSLSQTNEQSQVVQLQEKVAAAIARVYLVPLHMLAINNAQPRANMEQYASEFVSQALRPRLVRWEERIAVDVLDSDPRLFVEFNLEDLMRGDAATRAAVYRSGIEAGWLLRNEARTKENLNELPGLSEPVLPLNMSSGGAPKP